MARGALRSIVPSPQIACRRASKPGPLFATSPRTANASRPRAASASSASWRTRMSASASSSASSSSGSRVNPSPRRRLTSSVRGSRATAGSNTL